jgi:type VI secretion system VasD/TssJ family lipoprotein
VVRSSLPDYELRQEPYSPPSRWLDRLFAVSIVLAATLSSCSKLPLVGGKPTLKVDMTATATCNSCGAAVGYPLTVRVLQVTDASAMTGASLVQFWDRESQVLGEALLGKPVQDVLDPGSKKEWKLDRDPKAKAVVVVGNFCKTEGSCWNYVQELEGDGGASLELYFDEACVREVRR